MSRSISRNILLFLSELRLQLVRYIVEVVTSASTSLQENSALCFVRLLYHWLVGWFGVSSDSGIMPRYSFEG